MNKSPAGVLVMAYGTPSSLDEVEAYYTHIRRGVPPTPALLAELKARYEAIGGVSPLSAITRRQAARLEEELNRREPGRFRVYTGMKHSLPLIEDTVRRMHQDGIREAVGLVLAPHYSAMSVGSYIRQAEETAQQAGGPRFSFIRQWHLEPQFVEALAQRVIHALQRFPEAIRNEVPVIFSAHSLPKKILERNDPYPSQLEETGNAVAEAVGLHHWLFAWQSAGRTAEPWLGPDILEVLDRLYQEGNQSVVVCPAGFVSDHLEVLYDIDIECQAFAKQRSMHLERTAMFNDAPDFIRLLADLVRKQFAEPAEHH
jgi:ferrochelatase